ncbi:MAG TPA: glycosyl transferase [Methylotenera sp.]|nr:glycosyl transferase [Methylotenera sp.]HPH05932.1 glycosyl transferase [Methylotenera sp.]HPN00713.1 glycosyl transferase [Methylotenera sp.]
MRFQLDHDWQGNMSAPRARVGEGVKTQLLLALCAIWILLGLIGHSPWKPLESSSISIVHGMLNDGSFIAPLPHSVHTLESPPLYYLTAAASAFLLSPILDIHDGARLINAIWLSIMLLMVGMTGREMWSQGVGRHATFIMIGTIGLVLNAHSLNIEVAHLTSLATGFYALALSKRRPWRASGLFGAALASGFLSYGILPLLILLSTAIVLPLIFSAWRSSSYSKFLTSSLAFASVPIAAWLIALQQTNPALYANWWQVQFDIFQFSNHLYFARILVWYAWPALPLALLGLWHYRYQLLIKPKFQLTLVFFICCLTFLGLCASAKDISAMPLLLPLVALGAGSVEHLKRGFAAALNWFGVLLFGIIGGLIWLGWFAMLTDFPAKLKERMQFLSGLDGLAFNWVALALALLMTLIWAFVCIRAKQTNKSSVTNWAVGMTFSWVLLMTLWLPMIDSAKSYQQAFTNMQLALPKNYQCINSLNVGLHQRLLLNYHTNITLIPFEGSQTLNCDFYLLQDTKGNGIMQPGTEWQKIWAGRRNADRKEGFRLFKRISENG